LAVAGPSLESRLEDRRRLGLLVADLGRLPDRQRAALVMRELSDLSHEEIGYALELPVSGVKQAIFDARKGLQEFEAGRAMNCDVVQRAISDCDGRALRARRLRAHLEACADCASWRDAIGSRRQMLGSLVAPIGPGSAVAILARITHLMDTGGGGVAAAVAKAAAGTAAGKAVLGAALVAVTAGGMAEVHRAQAHPAAGSAGRPNLAARPAARRPATSTFTAQPPKLPTRQRLGPHDNRLQPATPAPGDPGAGVQPDASGPKVSPVAGSPSTDGSDHGKGPNRAGPPGLLKQSTAAPSSTHGKSTKGIAAPGQLKKSTAAPSTKHGKSTNGTGAPGRLKKQKAGSPSPRPAPPPGNAPSAGAPPGQTKKADTTQPSPTPPPGNGPPAGGPPGQADKGGTSESSSDQSSSNAQPNGGQHGSSQGQGQGQGNKSGK
jgi:hypothetical protein